MKATEREKNIKIINVSRRAIRHSKGLENFPLTSRGIPQDVVADGQRCHKQRSHQKFWGLVQSLRSGSPGSPTGCPTKSFNFA